MNKIYGYVGKIARINLTDSTVTYVSTFDYVPKYIGGRGVCNKIFWDEVGPGVKAFDPKNKLIFMTGPTTSTGIPTGGRSTMCSISPNNLPEQYCWSGIGGWFGTMVKFAGYDGFIIEGKAPEPTYIFIDDGKITFHSAKELWGMLVHETQKKLEEILGQDVNSIVIGPAGENLVRNASITTSNDSVAAKAGFGAVFGSKNLKAISVRGTGKVQAGNVEKILQLHKTMGKPIGKLNPIQYKDSFSPRPHIDFPVPGGVKEGRVACSYGCNQHCNLILFDVKAGIGGNEKGRTNVVNKCVGIYAYKMIEDSGWTPQMSFNTPQNDYAGCRFISGDGFTPDLSDPALKEGFLERRLGDIVNYWDGDYDRGNVINNLCTQYGIDRWDVIIWYMSWLAMAKKEGVLDDIDFGLGMEVDPSSEEFMKRFLEMIVYRKGYYGNIFAEGMARAIRTLGMEKYGKTIYTGRISQRTGKQQIIPISLESAWGHCCHWAGRGFQGSNDITCWLPIAIELMTSTRDAQTNTHHHDSFDYYLEVRDDPCHNPRVASSIIFNEHCAELKESLMSCEFQLPQIFDKDIESEMFEAATGIKMTHEEIYLAAERIKNLFRAILIRNHGRTRDLEVNEVYPILTYPDADGKTVSWEDFNYLVDMYYEQRGWDKKTGWPTRETYEKLGLKEVADELEAIGKLPENK
ncbi:MAG: aldehyde ferredoxin oxidoreductase [Peptococcaceae bacterium]|nr:aldehyde ferredoxin oxidoreductase [Peptococcaceae bacterium]